MIPIWIGTKLRKPGSGSHTSPIRNTTLMRSVADPNPDPDPHVFGPPGSGSGTNSQRYGSGSGSRSFYHQPKIVRNTLIPTVLRLWLFIFENDVHVPLKINKQKNLRIWIATSILSVIRIRWTTTRWARTTSSGWTSWRRSGTAGTTLTKRPHSPSMQNCLCCGSRIRLLSIPDPNFFHPGSAKPQKRYLSSRKYGMIWIVHPGSGSWLFTPPGSRGQKGTGSRIQIRNTENCRNLFSSERFSKNMFHFIFNWKLQGWSASPWEFSVMGFLDGQVNLHAA